VTRVRHRAGAVRRVDCVCYSSKQSQLSDAVPCGPESHSEAETGKLLQTSRRRRPHTYPTSFQCRPPSDSAPTPFFAARSSESLRAACSIGERNDKFFVVSSFHHRTAEVRKRLARISSLDGTGDRVIEPAAILLPVRSTPSTDSDFIVNATPVTERLSGSLRVCSPFCVPDSFVP
jgi:hypothetical protein